MTRLLLVLLLSSLFSSYLGKKIPYLKVKVCNNNVEDVVLFLEVELYPGRYQWRYDDSIPKQSCVERLKVLPNRNYGIQYDFGDDNQEIVDNFGIAKSLRFTTDVKEYIFDEIHLDDLPSQLRERLTARTPSATTKGKDTVSSKSVPAEKEDVKEEKNPSQSKKNPKKKKEESNNKDNTITTSTTNTKKNKKTKKEKDNNSNDLHNVTTLDYLKQYNSTILSRELFPFEREPKKIRVSIISLLPFEFTLCKKTFNQLEPINTISPQEEFLLLAEIGDEFAAVTVKPNTQQIDFLFEFPLKADQRLYVIGDADKLSDVDYKFRKSIQARRDYMKSYYEQNGRHYVAYYDGIKDKPRKPPKLFYWPTDYIGQTHNVTSKNPQWKCNFRQQYKCNKPKSSTFQLHVISTSPKVLLIPNLLSNEECQEIRYLASPVLEKSKILVKSNNKSEKNNKIRTSSNAWISRDQSPIVTNVFKRIADVLQLPYTHLTIHTGAEHLQVVRYLKNEYYNSHYDWSQGDGNPYTRFITILLYLNDYENITDARHAANSAHKTSSLLLEDDLNADYLDEDNEDNEEDDEEVVSEPKGEDNWLDPKLYEGGETAFFKANDNKGFALHPGKGSAVVFYNLLEDGNGDEMALHSSLPVKKGIKWLANLWIWDPKLTPKTFDVRG